MKDFASFSWYWLRRIRRYDYIFLEVNPSFEKQTGLAHACGKSMRPSAWQLEEHWFEMFGEIALTGKSR